MFKFESIYRWYENWTSGNDSDIRLSLVYWLMELLELRQISLQRDIFTRRVRRN